MENENCRGQS